MPSPKIFKKCRQCGKSYQAWSKASNLNRWCGHECAIQWQAEKRERLRLKAMRREKREYRQANKKRGEYEKEAQWAVNEFVRIRDQYRPCIVHGIDCPNKDAGWDAGHFQAVGMGGGSPLRFNLWNIHKQCAVGNRGSHKWSRYQKGTDALYEEGLRKRIGDERVDWLKGSHEPTRYTIEDLQRIKRIFSKRAKLYQKIREKYGVPVEVFRGLTW